MFYKKFFFALKQLLFSPPPALWTQSDYVLWAVRCSAGLSMLCFHGFGKLTNFSNIAPHFPDPLFLGSTLSLFLVTGAEFFGSILLILGLFTRLASFSLLFTMFVVIVVMPEPLKDKELAILYALIFYIFMMLGGGKYSLDRFVQKWLSPSDKTASDSKA